MELVEGNRLFRVSVCKKKILTHIQKGERENTDTGREWGKGFGVKLRVKETKRRKELEKKEKKWR